MGFLETVLNFRQQLTHVTDASHTTRHMTHPDGQRGLSWRSHPNLILTRLVSDLIITGSQLPSRGCVVAPLFPSMAHGLSPSGPFYLFSMTNMCDRYLPDAYLWRVYYVLHPLFQAKYLQSASRINALYLQQRYLPPLLPLPRPPTNYLQDT